MRSRHKASWIAAVHGSCRRDCRHAVAAADVTVFAAASLKEALDDQARQFEASTGNKVVVSYGASNALAKQIEAGAPADLFISADLDWMDYVDQRHLLTPGTRVNLLRNTLVLVAPASSKSTLKIGPNFGLAAALGPGEAGHGQSRQRAGGKVRQGRARETGRLVRCREAGRPGGERARGAGARVPRRSALRHRVLDRRACPTRAFGSWIRFRRTAIRPSSIPRPSSRRASRRRPNPCSSYLRSARGAPGLGEDTASDWRNRPCSDSARTKSESSR